MKTSKKLIGLTLIAFVSLSKQAQFNADNTIASYQSAFNDISDSLNNSLNSMKSGVSTGPNVTVVKPTIAKSTAVSSSSANAIASDNSVATAQSTQTTGANAVATKNSSANSGAVSNSTANAIAAKDSVANAVSSGNNNANAVASNQSTANTNSNTSTNSLSQAVNNSQANSIAASNTNSNAIAQDKSVAVSNANSNTNSLSQAANNSQANSAAVSNNNSQATALNGSVAVSNANSNTGSAATAVNGSTADSLANSNTSSVATALNGSVSLSNANTNTGSNAVAVNGSQSVAVNNNQALSNSAAVNGGFSSNTANSNSNINSVSVNGTIYQPNSNSENCTNTPVNNHPQNNTVPYTTPNVTNNSTKPNNSNNTNDCDNQTVTIPQPPFTTNCTNTTVPILPLTNNKTECSTNNTNTTISVPAPTNNNTECPQPISSIPLCKGISPKDDDKFFYAQYNETHEILISLKVHKANEKYLKSKTCDTKNNTQIDNSSVPVQEGSEEFYDHCRGVCINTKIDFCETTKTNKPERLFRCKCSGIISPWHFKIGGGFERCPHKDLSNCQSYMTNQLILSGGVNKNDILDMFNNVQVDKSHCNNKKLRGSKHCLIPDNKLENAEREQFYSKDKLMEFRGNYKVAGNAVNHVHRLMDEHREDKNSLVPEFNYQQAVKLHERPHVNITNLNHIHKCNDDDLKHIHMGLPDYAKEIKFEFGNKTKSNNKTYKCDEDEKKDIVDDLKHVGV